MACSTVRTANLQQMGSVEPRRKYQPGGCSGKASCITAVRQIRQRELARKSSTDVPVRKSVRWMWTIAVSSVCCRKWIPESLLMIALKGANRHYARSSCNMSQRTADILRDDYCQPWRTINAPELENERKRSAYCASSVAETGENGDCWRRGYLCLMVRGKSGPRRSRPRETFVPFGLIT